MFSSNDLLSIFSSSVPCRSARWSLLELIWELLGRETAVDPDYQTTQDSSLKMTILIAIFCVCKIEPIQKMGGLRSLKCPNTEEDWFNRENELWMVDLFIFDGQQVTREFDSRVSTHMKLNFTISKV